MIDIVAGAILTITSAVIGQIDHHRRPVTWSAKWTSCGRISQVSNP